MQESPALLRELDLVLGSNDILTRWRKSVLPEHAARLPGKHGNEEYDVLNRLRATDFHAPDRQPRRSNTRNAVDRLAGIRLV